jgi:hypothetical protein
VSLHRVDLFDTCSMPKHDLGKWEMGKSRNKEIKELFTYGLGCHHAGMLRSDRSLTERLFAGGLLKVGWDRAFVWPTDSGPDASVLNPGPLLHGNSRLGRQLASLCCCDQ